MGLQVGQTKNSFAFQVKVINLKTYVETLWKKVSSYSLHRKKLNAYLNFVLISPPTQLQNEKKNAVWGSHAEGTKKGEKMGETTCSFKDASHAIYTNFLFVS